MSSGDESKQQRRPDRFPVVLKATARTVAAYGARDAPTITVCGTLRNIGQGGVGFVADRGLPVSALVECRIFFPSVPVAIPTLLSVRWSRKHPTGGKHDIGLQFLMDEAHENVLRHSLQIVPRGTRE